MLARGWNLPYFGQLWQQIALLCAVVEHMVCQAVLPFAQTMPGDAMNQAAADEILCNPFRQ
jgi:hypothetical protein